MIGQTVSHYKILEKLGEGGMGVVYKAQDTKLDRTVALKFLPHHVTASEAEQARFLQEAKAAATLNHPNVCVIHSIDEVEDKQFIVMEYVDGVTLREKILRRGEVTSPLQMDVVIGYAIQIGEALQEAHSKGIVHRDIKCENIMVNGRNQIKVMDFGLAKLKGSLKLTKTSSTVGTLAYMAPEQIQGGEVDARSDIFSFGVVLFEMLTGKMPFRGEHDAAIMYSILNEEPDSLQKYIPDPPAEIVHVIAKALEKNPDERYQSVSEMIVDLRRVKRDSAKVSRSVASMPVSALALPQTTERPVASSTISSTKPRTIRYVLIAGGVIIVAAVLLILQPWKSDDGSAKRKSLAVIPFENIGDPSKEYFADGITDEITGNLSRLSGLGVIARSSAKEYKKTTKTIKQIGEELGVDFVLMGTVRWSEGGERRVRVNPELINTKTTMQTWSHAFEAAYSDAFKIQADVASEVARALDVQLLQHEKENLSGKLTTNAQAYDYYLKGREYEDRSPSKADREIAIEQYERAVALDPAFAGAYARLGASHANMYWFFYDRTPERVEKARLACEKALALAPNLSEAHEAMGWYHYHTQLDYTSAINEFSIALELNPNNSEVSYGLAAVFRRQGNMDESIKHWRKVVGANPRNTELERQLAETLTLARKYAEADEHYNNSIRLAPDNATTYGERALNYILWRGDLKLASVTLDEGVKYGRAPSSEDNLLIFMRSRVGLMRGDYEGADQALNSSETGAGLDNQFVYYPRSLLLATVAAVRNPGTRARSLYLEAVETIGKRLKQSPDDERAHSSLGIAYAGLGRKDEAIRSALKGVELLPVEKEAWRGSHRLINLAMVYTMVGEQEKALDVLERLLSIPSEVSGQLLKLDPTWKPLRDSKRFQALVRGG